MNANEKKMNDWIFLFPRAHFMAQKRNKKRRQSNYSPINYAAINKSKIDTSMIFKSFPGGRHNGNKNHNNT